MLQFCLEEHLQMCTGQWVFSLWSNLQNFSALSFDDRPVGICLWVAYLSPNALGNKSPRGSSQDYLPDYCLKQFGLFFWRLGFLSDPSPMFALPCHSVKNEVEFTQPLQKSRNLSWIMLNLIVGFVKVVTYISRPLQNKNKPRTLNKVELNCHSCNMDLAKLLHVFLALCQTKISWRLIKILKLADWLKALNKVWRLNASGPMCPWQCFYEICKKIFMVPKKNCSMDLCPLLTRW